MADRPLREDVERWKADPQIREMLDAISNDIRALLALSPEEARARGVAAMRRRVDELNAGPLEARVEVLAALYDADVDGVRAAVTAVEFAVEDDMTLRVNARLRRSVERVNITMTLAAPE